MGYSDEEIEHTVGVCIVNGVSTGENDTVGLETPSVFLSFCRGCSSALFCLFYFCSVCLSSRCRRGSVRATRGTVPPRGPRSSPRPPSAHTTAGPTPGSGTHT
jgi:hypothetical protein